MVDCRPGQGQGRAPRQLARVADWARPICRRGTEAALWKKTNLAADVTDISSNAIERRRAIQSLAWSHLSSDPDARAKLRLPPRDPQCYYDIRAQLDASLVSMSADNQACLREAARWATVLRAQAMCEAANTNDKLIGHVPAHAGLTCSRGVVRYRNSLALGTDGGLPGDCSRATRCYGAGDEEMAPSSR
jgi:hypothetical protein